MEDGNDEDVNDLEERVGELESKIGELEEKIEESQGRFISGGYAMGMALAMVLSWSKNASILWCMLHGLLSWIYVIYFAIKR